MDRRRPPLISSFPPFPWLPCSSSAETTTAARSSVFHVTNHHRNSQSHKQAGRRSDNREAGTAALPQPRATGNVPRAPAAMPWELGRRSDQVRSWAQPGGAGPARVRNLTPLF
jgi:hypothetical protein